jgi:hypothetical protein
VTVEIGRSVLNVEGHVDGAGRSDAVERVGSSRFLPSEGVTALFDRRVINRYLGRPWPVAEHTLALVAYVVVLESPLTHSCLIVFIGSSERAILVRLHCKIASSGTR